MKKCIVICSLLFVFSIPNFFAQVANENTADANDKQVQVAVLGNSDVLLQGLNAYKNEDWNTALFFLRKAVTDPKNSTPDTWYVMIMTEIFAGDNENALRDGNIFLERFPDSKFIPQITYQKSRTYFDSGNYNQAIIDFSAFCKKWPNHELTVSAMFWTAESFYQLYQFSEAKNIFQKIVLEYSDSSKYVEAEYRLELLNQREREEKLLYLLRVTGEEYLAAREEYERRLSLYENEDLESNRNQMKELQKKVEVLSLKNSELQSEYDLLSDSNEILRTATADAAQSLRMAAAEKKAYLAGIASNNNLLAADKTTDTSSVPSSSVDSKVLSESIAVEQNTALEELLKKAAELEKLLQPQAVPKGEE